MRVCILTEGVTMVCYSHTTAYAVTYAANFVELKVRKLHPRLLNSVAFSDKANLRGQQVYNCHFFWAEG